MLLYSLFFISLTTAYAGNDALVHETLQHDGLIRNYYVFDPRSDQLAAPQTRRPMILVLHGGGGYANNFKQVSGEQASFENLGRREDILIVFPEGEGRQWNDGRGAWTIRAQRQNVDDSGFLSKLIDLQIRNRNVDAQRVYVTGLSNGGFMSNRAACDLSDKVAAVGIVIAGMPPDLRSKCHPVRAISVMMIEGSDDPLVPYNGGEVTLIGVSRGQVLSAQDSFMFWAKNAGYHGEFSSLAEQVLSPATLEDDTRVTKRTFQDSYGNSVELLTVWGGGHTWPGGRQYFFKKFVGKITQHINATEELWKFFRRTSLPSITPKF